MLLAAACWAAASVAAQPASDGDLAEYQARIGQRMAGLEQRLLEMADLIEADQPDRAERLRRSFQLSRERLIVPGMDRIGSLLEQERYAEAAQLERQILDDLGRLAELLSAEQWAQELDRLRDAASRVEDLLRGQLETLERTRGLLGPGQEAARDLASRYGEAWEGQRRIAEQAEGLHGDMGGLPGADHVASAMAAMQRAEAALHGRAGPDAAEAESRAAGYLQAAAAALREAISRLEVEQRARLVQRLEAILREMLQEQQAILAETESMERLRTEAGGTLTRAQLLDVAALARREDGLSALADEALAALEQGRAGFSLPAALRTVREDVGACADLLRQGRTGFAVQELQREVIGLLQGLIQALAAARSEQPKEPPEPPRTERPKEAEPGAVDAAMELSVMRAMQVSLNQRTVRLHRLEQDSAVPPDELSAGRARLADGQAKVRHVLAQLQEALQRSANK